MAWWLSASPTGNGDSGCVGQRAVWEGKAGWTWSPSLKRLCQGPQQVLIGSPALLLGAAGPSEGLLDDTGWRTSMSWVCLLVSKAVSPARKFHLDTWGGSPQQVCSIQTSKERALCQQNQAKTMQSDLQHVLKYLWVPFCFSMRGRDL